MEYDSKKYKSILIEMMRTFHESSHYSSKPCSGQLIQITCVKK